MKGTVTRYAAVACLWAWASLAAAQECRPYWVRPFDTFHTSGGMLDPLRDGSGPSLFPAGENLRVPGPPPGSFLQLVGCRDQCYADCNNDRALTLADFACFQGKFTESNPYGDCNGDGAINVGDFGCFSTKFAMACP